MLKASGIWPGNMPERDDGGFRQPFANHLRQQREMIVLNQNHGIRPLGLLNDGLGKPLVDGAILVPVGFPEDRPDKGDMAERPQPLIGKAVVVAVLFFLRQPDTPERIERVIRAARECDRVRRQGSRSALPLPCATQVPPQARMIGSIAATRPLAGFALPCRLKCDCVYRALDWKRRSLPYRAARCRVPAVAFPAPVNISRVD